ncbi:MULTISPECIES: poly-beta-1,6-N-acetyl-D-glucosamine synthase [Vreelandella]|uniref:Poly-beta-1,6-N-acetyl-D-glucosamine synthase n=2 Tax=Vreelandella TaxID=3137766 RepID=A0A7C9P5S7_9GAMM|nr:MULTISPECIES: poly-beta-1,6-N-acetyl-D-glucosamine synthase [Halomonas]NDL69394.1 poly-beta-1,6 N-acetyl-D-glucosamine synthase [Halomonas alkaliphila]NYS43898.1 poly-beta-1,6 N-acetyl-D-glucosamine synthase [Halomonas zhaodongensis]
MISDAIKSMQAFTFLYPAVMAIFWMGGGLYYYWRNERHSPGVDSPPLLKNQPLVSILVPCHNEGDNIEEVVETLLLQHYPMFEILLINDGSADDTAEYLDRLSEKHDQVRAVHLDRNLGKANALRMGALAARSEYLVCIDGDALLHPDAVAWLVAPLLENPRIGAVTGNPRIRNRSTLLGKLQVGEFSSIIGMIKRAQQAYGRLFTISGVICAFRKQALHEIDYWATDMMTEDIDVSWRLQMAKWRLYYEPHALCYILMPETLKGLWKQRLRWAQGGTEVVLRYFRRIIRPTQLRMWPLYLEYLVSVIWAYVMVSLLLLWGVGLFGILPEEWTLKGPYPRSYGLLLALICLTQFCVSLLIDSRYEPKVGRHYYWLIWYPIVYWLLSMLTTLVAFPKTLFRRRGKFATWTSTDRGYKE